VKKMRKIPNPLTIKEIGFKNLDVMLDSSNIQK
jgi:hypothetical protein